MSTLRLYLWKEWREHRSTALVLAAIVLLVTLLTAKLAPSDVLNDWGILSACLGFALVGIVQLVGGDVVTSDLGGSRQRFLERIPGGLQRAFAAKLIFYVTMILCFAALGIVLGVGATYLRTGQFPGLAARQMGACVALVIALVSVWSFAVSAWVPRGSLALPTAVLVLASTTAPLIRLLDAVRYIVQPWELAGMVLLTLVGAPLVGWVSSVHGRRFGRGRVRAFCLGALSALPFLVPTPIWIAVRHAQLEELDMGAAELLGARSNVERTKLLLFWSQTVPWLEVPKVHTLQLDLTTGQNEVVSDSIWWTEEFGHQLAIGKDGGPFKTLHAEPAGLGTRYQDKAGGWRLFDPFRQRSYPSELGYGVLTDAAGVVITPHGWVVYAYGRKYLQQEFQWVLFDPDSGEQRVLDWPAGFHGRVVLPNGHLIIGNSATPMIGDPATGACYPIRGDEWSSGSGAYLGLPWGRFDPLGPVLLTGAKGIYRLDLENYEIERVIAFNSWDELRIILAESKTTLLAIQDKRRIVRYDLESGETEVVFP